METIELLVHIFAVLERERGHKRDKKSCSSFLKSWDHKTYLYIFKIIWTKSEYVFGIKWAWFIYEWPVTNCIWKKEWHRLGIVYLYRKGSKNMSKSEESTSIEKFVITYPPLFSLQTHKNDEAFAFPSNFFQTQTFNLPVTIFYSWVFICFSW